MRSLPVETARDRTLTWLRKRSSQTRSKSPSARQPRPEPARDVSNAQRPPDPVPVPIPPYDEGEPGPSFGSIFGSARLALDPPQPISFNYSFPTSSGSGGGNGAAATINPASLVSSAPPPSQTTSDPLWLTSPTHLTETDSTPILSHDPHVPFPQISVFATWEHVGFFLSLHMLHQHVLTPLVHQPSFARDLLHRRDIHDEAFRGLLLSIGTLAT